MQLFEITNRKEFMAKLLKSDLFDTFEVREVIAHMAFKIIISGERNQDYFTDLNEESLEPRSDYLAWGELRRHVYELMQGSKLPTYFKIILSTNKEKTASLSTDASTFYLNITFKENQISCSTGMAYKTFTMDKSSETLWDEKIKNFLFKYEFM